MITKKLSLLLAFLLLTSQNFALSDDEEREVASRMYEKVTQKKLLNGDTLTEYVLPNGLQVLHVPRHQAKVLTYQAWFKVGSIHEKLDPKLKKTGLAHLFEHMMFRGTKKYPEGKFDEITARLGGENQNATTWFVRTNYFESIPSNQLEELMTLEADRMENLNLISDLFEKEKGAVVGELRLHLDRPTSLANDELMKLVFNEAPYRYTVIGSEEEIKGFTLDEAKYFYKTFYAPNNGTLIIIGDITGDKLMDLVVKYYGDMKRQPIPKTSVPVEPVQKAERKLVTTHSQATSDVLMVAYRIPSEFSPEIVPFSLMQAHLSVGTEARLKKVLVDTGIAVGAGAYISSNPDLMEFSVQLAEGQSAEKALKVIDKEVATLKTKKIDKSSFERALNQEKLNVYTEIVDNSSLARILGESLVTSGNYMRGFEVVEEYKNIKPADIQAVAKKYLVPKNRSYVIVRPASKGK